MNHTTSLVSSAPMEAVLYLHQTMQHWRGFCIASIISHSSSRRRGATIISSSLHPLSEHQQHQQQQQQQLQLLSQKFEVWNTYKFMMFIFYLPFSNKVFGLFCLCLSFIVVWWVSFPFDLLTSFCLIGWFHGCPYLSKHTTSSVLEI